MDKHVIETDLLVAGGGMAGISAAIAAARQGMRVVLVQDRSVLGGNASSEVKMHIVGADCHGSRKGWRETGIIEEIRLEDSVRNPSRCYPLWDVILYEKVVAEPNITLLLDTDIVGATMENDAPNGDAIARPNRTERMYEFVGKPGRIKSATAVRNITEDQFEIRAKYYADCTGDGRLGFEAGADYRIGRESKSMHDESLAVDVDDVHTLGSSILITTRRTEAPVKFIPPAWARKFDPEQLKVGRGIHTWEYGFWWIEWGGVLDSIKDHTTVIRHELYRIALGLWDYVKNSGRFPESENWTLDWVGAIPGKRESRRFMGPHVLTQADVLDARKHADEVAYGGWAIDLHPVKGIDAIDEPPFTPTHGKDVYGIPLRCYFSRNIENLFFAGRNISATHVAFASTRVMATCAIGGEAIGNAAAYCVKRGVTPGQLVLDGGHVRALRQQLLKTDVTLLDSEPDLGHTKTATITASSSAETFPATLVADNWSRNLLDMKTGELITAHGWRSGELAAGSPQWLQLAWDAPIEIREVRLTFDTGFEREVMLTPLDRSAAKHVRAAQPETVKDYTISIDGQVVATVTGNYQRQRVHKLAKPVRGKTLRINATATNGAPEARLFQIAVE